jgi:hypothetical protein
LKTFLAFLFILITFLSVSKPMNASCDDSHTKSSISVDEKVSVLEAAAPCNEDNHSDASHEHGACHNCHLGHCSFTIGTNVVLFSIYELAGFVPVKVNFNLSDFKSSPFRPPIS